MSMLRVANIVPDKPSGPPPFVVSPIKRMHSAWHYLWPFQSRKALVTTFFLLAAGSLAWTMLLMWFDPGALPFVLVGTLIGGVYLGPYRVLSAQITITARGDVYFPVNVVKQLILNMTYMAGNPTGDAGHLRYVHKWTVKPYCWLSYDQEINLRCRDNEIRLSGPINAIEWVHSQLTKQLAA